MLFGYMSEEDVEILDKSTTVAKNAVIEILKNGIDIAMNKFNKKE